MNKKADLTQKLKSLSSIFFTSVLLFSQISLANKTSLAQRIDTISASFLGAKYIGSPLGEGTGRDADPLIRFDAFDCTTYVETVGSMALTNSTDPAVIIKKLNQIRYSDGIPNFLTRNHFTSLDWIPNNVAKGLYVDLTQRIFGKNSYILDTEINKTDWFQKNFSIILHGQSSINSSLSVIDLEEIFNNPNLINNIPNAAVINLILTNDPTMQSKIGTNLDIRHQGFLIWKDGTLYIRHAKGPSYGVYEEPFMPLMKRLSEIKKFDAISIGIFSDEYFR